MNTVLCEQCGREYRVGQWYQCPHDPFVAAVIDDQLEGGPRRFETLGHDEPYIETKSQLRREMEARGLRHIDRYVPGDTQLSNWAAGIDAYTLDAARALLTRGSRVASSPSPGQLETLELSVRELKRLEDVA